MTKVYLLLTFWIITNQSNAQVFYGVNNYTQYHQGELPIIISAPHGGLVTPSNIPDRTCNSPTYDLDSKTIELSRQIDTALFKLTGCRPHLIICNLRRTKVDCNRNIADGACANADAETAWTEFHDFLDTAQFIAQNQYSKKALYIDLHGHGKQPYRLELGYGLTGTQLGKSDSILNTSTYVTASSFKKILLTNTSGSTHAQLIRGTHSLGTMLVNAGFPSVPSMQTPNPGITPFFPGGYNTFNHTCIKVGNEVNGLQIECDSTIRFSYLNRKRFADSIAQVLVRFLTFHQNINFSDCKRRPPVIANIQNQNSIVGNLFNLTVRPFVDITNGDSILAYSLSGTLPNGLNFDTTNGILSGNPTIVGNSTLIVKCKDIDGYSNIDTFLISINPQPNNNPKANKDSFNLNDGITITTNPRTNDIDSDGDSIIITNVNPTSQGIIAVVNSGKNIQYTSPLNFNGLISCYYKISDGKGGIDSANISFKITDTTTITNSIVPILNEDIKIYPNPTEGTIIIENLTKQKDLTCDIYDLVGNSVFKTKLQNSKSKLNIELILKGTYIIEVKSNIQKIVSKKIEKL